jgi:hypothetical protein
MRYLFEGEHKVRPYIGLVNKKMRNLLFKHSLLHCVGLTQGVALGWYVAALSG